MLKGCLEELIAGSRYMYEALNVELLGPIGDTLFVSVNGRKYGYVPKSSTDIDTLDHTFRKMLKYSYGKALAWLKKNAKLASGSVRGVPRVVRDMSPSLMAHLSQMISDGADMDSIVEHLLESGDPSVVDTVIAVNSWWKSNVGAAVLQALTKMRSQTEGLKLERVLYKDGFRLSILSETTANQSMLQRYNSALLSVSDLGMTQDLVAIDFDKATGSVLLWFDENTTKEDLVQLVNQVKSGSQGTRIVAGPDDIILDSIPVDNYVVNSKLWFVWASEKTLPDLDFRPVEEEIPDESDAISGSVEVDSSASNGVEISGEVTVQT